MVTVSTKEGLKKAIENRETRILVTGELAKTMRRKAKVKKASAVGAAALIIGGVVAIPFSGGASAGLTAMGLTAMGLTVGTVTVSTAELAILCGFTLGVIGLCKKCKVKFNPDGSVEITPQY